MRKPAHTVVLVRPVYSIADLGLGIIAAVYDDEDLTDARPVPRNLDALADLLRETQVSRLVVANWRVCEELTAALLHVFDNEGILLSRIK
ncbi:hypothetical protein [Corynebacterium tuscaniense]|uniref:hypothetical protein n=1 Tax=Corynebacterium tuscaniense TaxID=302449 RepID=UPI00050FD957|nr:hypothetical protein [Corynebacterium tuscaniense]KGF21655.1 hypothetical protein HMPREF2129_09115 [Corynebacterium tuscaniense DNF00037]